MIKRLKSKWIWYVLSVIYKANKWLMFLLVFSNVFIALIPMVQMIAFANLIDTVVQMKQVGFSSLMVLPVIGILILLLIIKNFTEKIYSLINASLINRMRNGYVMTLLEKHARLEYKYLENPESLDLFARVMNSPEQKLYDCLMNLIGTISLFITIISLASTIVYYTWYIGLLLLVVAIPLMMVAVRGGRATYEANKIATKYQRKYQYYGDILTNRESSLERSLFGYGLRLNDTWKENFEIARKINFKTITKWILRSSVYGIISIVVLAVIIICLVYMTIQRIMSIGIFIALINAIYQLSGKMTYELSSQMESLVRNREYVREVKQFLDMTEVDGATHNPADPPIPFDSLQFADVWFKYPGTDTYILKGLSFLLEKGKHYSFVGTNGAGKSTIIKLIIGLYTEYEGEILLNGKSIRDYSQSDLKSICAVAFQDYSCYFISIHDNIALGNINHTDEQEIQNSIDTLQLNDLINNLPQGIGSRLGKLTEQSIDISGGQWQKIALARFFINPGTLRILDEPTAALDPISESKVYKDFELLSKNKTAIFISHRLGSTKLADIIFVINDGVIAETGDHNELVEQDGIYTKMYDSQRMWYT